MLLVCGMNIAILSPVWFRVPPDGYGGIELVVSLLADGLVDAGHDVTLFASGDSTTRARLDAVFDEAPSESIGKTFWELQHAINCFERHEDFDVIHDHTGLLGLALGSLLSTPLVHTVHGPLTGAPGELYESVARLAPRAQLVSLSMAQRRPRPDLPWLANVANGIDLSSYPFEPHEGDYLLFLGRMSPDKGAHRAIRIAQNAGIPLKLAGKNAEPGEHEYFDEHVRPYIGRGIEYLGEVSHDEKVELLRRARATLFPISWEEPFGLVMIESMACGTPVIASRRGSVPEVIDDGVSGIIVDDWNAIDDILERAERLDPQAMRHAVEERFSPNRMVADYVAAYHKAIGVDATPDWDEGASQPVLVPLPGPRLATGFGAGGLVPGDPFEKA
jgi:glycosyltransferase involved in cell wall biosynthesis